MFDRKLGCAGVGEQGEGTRRRPKPPKEARSAMVSRPSRAVHDPSSTQSTSEEKKTRSVQVHIGSRRRFSDDGGDISRRAGRPSVVESPQRPLNRQMPETGVLPRGGRSNVQRCRVGITIELKRTRTHLKGKECRVMNIRGLEAEPATGC